MSREVFAQELYEIVKETGIRQNVIAQAMGLSSAAISQFTHGTALPSKRQLKTLLTMLCVPIFKQDEMLSLLIEAKKEFDQEIEPEEVTEDDNRDQEDLLLLDQPVLDQFFRTAHNQTILTFAQPNGGVPLIELSDMQHYNNAEDVFDFACNRQLDTIIRDYGSLGRAVILKTNGSQLNLNYEGSILIVIAADMEQAETSLKLSYYSNRKFFIETTDDKFGKNGNFILQNQNGSKQRRVWSFPILELNIIPVKSRFFHQGDF